MVAHPLNGFKEHHHVCKTTRSNQHHLTEHAGGDITSTFDAPEATKLGHAKLIEEIMIGEDRLIHFSGVAKAEACTIVLRGASGSLSPQAQWRSTPDRKRTSQRYVVGADGFTNILSVWCARVSGVKRADMSEMACRDARPGGACHGTCASSLFPGCRLTCAGRGGAVAA